MRSAVAAPSAAVRILLALLVSLALLPALPAAPASATTTASPQAAAALAAAAGVSIEDGHLVWGIKESWRKYVGTDGTSVEDGATVTADGLFRFPLTGGSYDAATGTTHLTFAGSVHFVGYCEADGSCLLDTRYGNLTLDISTAGQVLRGDWAGRPRDAVDTSIVTAQDVALATLDTDAAQVTSDATSTSWTAIPAAATEAFVTYGAGTRLDPVSVVYAGPGGKPDLAERWDTEGVPVYAESGRWSSTTNQYNSRVLYASADGSLAHIVQSSDLYAPHTLVAVDPTTLEPLGAPLTIPHQGSSIMLLTSFDPATGAVFWLQPKDGPSGTANTVNRSVWDAASSTYTTTVVASLPADTTAGTSLPVTAMTWNSVSRELAIVYGDSTAAGQVPWTLSRTRASGASWTTETAVLTLPGDVTALLAGATRISGVFGSPATQTGPTVAVAPDGSYVVAGGGSARGYPGTSARTYLPVLHLSVAGDGAVAVRSIPGSVPPVVDPGAYYTGYTAVSATADGRVLLRGATPEFVAVTFPGGVPTLDPQGFTLDGGGNTEDTSNIVVADPVSGLDLTVNTTTGRLVAVDDRTVLTTQELAPLRGAIPRPLSVGPDGSFYVQSTLDQRAGFLRYALVGTVPEVTTQPQPRAITLTSTTTQRVTFSLTASATPAPGVQWQLRLPGAARFADVPGATSTTLALDASLAHDGAQVRAVVANAAGRTVTEVATLAVQAAPVIEAQPVSVSVYAGQVATFGVLAVGNPAPQFSWEREVAGTWAPVAAGPGITLDGSTLRLEASSALHGARLRAVVSNAVGTVRSSEVTLTVVDLPAPPATATTYTGVTLDWTGSPEWQRQPPDGSVAHYLSAGTSDGTAATYSAQTPQVTILQRAADGTTAPATWETRGAHVGAGGQASQLLRLTQGTARIEVDRSTTVTWPGSVSVSFYDGLVPFTLSDLTLTVTPAGEGTLVADLAGYHGDMANPGAPKVPVAPAADVVVATFSGVVVDPAGFVVTPAYAGVSVDPGAGASPQDRSTAGWGSWPAPFVGFHTTTGLAAYFYSTGGSFDAHKAPAPLAVGFDGAVPEIPPVVAPPGLPVTRPVVSELPPATLTTSADGTAIEGSLVWGVKSSFRSYITGTIAKGSISLLDGATSAGAGYWFGQSGTDWTPESGLGSTSYAGGVRFVGHSGVLDLTMSDPVVRIDSASRGTLLLRVDGGAPSPVASLDLAAAGRADVDGGVSYSNVPVTLTSSGAAMFSHGSSQFYAAGERMDSLSFSVGTTAAPRSQAVTTVASHSSARWTPPATPPATEGITIDPAVLATLRAGQQVTATAGGFLPGETEIKVVVYSEPIVLEENLVADAAGDVSWTGLLPTSLEPGEHTLTFQGSVDRGIVFTILEAETPAGCTVESASLTWGFKESFRSYISGTIANGDWTLADGATYATPAFTWPTGTGVFSVEDWTGLVELPGSIAFTGHGGLLSTTVKDPQLLVVDASTAYLLLDVSGVTMEDAMAGVDETATAEDVSFVLLDLAGGTVEVSEDGTQVTATDVPATITSEGFATFPNYEAGTAFDPVSFQITTAAECATEVEEVVEAPAEVTVEEVTAISAPADGAGGISWQVWAGVGLLAAALAATALVLATRRRAAAGRAAGVGVGAVAGAGPGAGAGAGAGARTGAGPGAVGWTPGDVPGTAPGAGPSVVGGVDGPAHGPADGGPGYGGPADGGPSGPTAPGGTRPRA